MEWRMKTSNVPTIGLSWPPHYSTKNTASSHPNGAKWHRPQQFLVLTGFNKSESLGARHDSHEATSENCGLVSHLG